MCAVPAALMNLQWFPLLTSADFYSRFLANIDEDDDEIDEDFDDDDDDDADNRDNDDDDEACTTFAARE